MANCRPYLAPGCLLVVTVPGGPMTDYDRHIGHRAHFDPDGLRALLERAGFEVSAASGAGYPVFNLYRRLMRALGPRLVSIAGSTKPSATSRIAMRAFGVGLRSTRLSRRGFVFIPQPKGHLTTDLYGVTFVNRAFVEQAWTPMFELVAWYPAILEDWQDAVVLRRR